ncbi:MAG: hypothetical protein JSW04_03150 [Desulfobacterales bacterium]|nr:MAG: hypothetical protein JSV38_12350 [Desulfobacterales bacterium]UCD90452.1 MAG: hypothetical protein JSW04_03150 [Desulfobacterales bacterium]
MGQIHYSIEFEIYESGGCDIHEKGQRYKYPADVDKLCPWLLDSVNSMVRVLQFGGTLPWKYEGTPYQKKIDVKGTTTEFVRCPDPTSSGVVVKIVRKKLNKPKNVGWA